MDAKTIQEAAGAITGQIAMMQEKGKTEWATWAMAEQVNKLLDFATQLLPEDAKAILPQKFKQGSSATLCNARYVDIAATTTTIDDLLASCL